MIILVEYHIAILHAVQMPYMYSAILHIQDDQLNHPIRRVLVNIINRQSHRKPNSASRLSTEAIHSFLRFIVAINAARNSSSV